MADGNGIGQRQVNWQEVLALLTLLAILVTSIKAWYWNEWRLTVLEQEQKEVVQSLKIVGEIDLKVAVIYMYMQQRGWIDKDGHAVQ